MWLPMKVEQFPDVAVATGVRGDSHQPPADFEY